MIHPANLRDRLVAFVHDRQRIGRQIIQQRRGRRAGRASGQMSRVVLDPVAVSDLLDHLQIEHGPLVQAVRLQDLAFGFERRPVPFELRLDGLDGQLGFLAWRDEVRFRVDRELVVLLERLARERIERNQLVDFVAEQLHPERRVVVRRIDFDDIAADAEHAAREIVVVAFVLDVDQLPEDLLAIDALSALERQHHAVVRLGRSEAVDAGDARDNDDVAALEERPRGRQPHAIDLVVDRRFLLDVGVGRRHVGFGLVVVVVADEVLDGVLGEEAPEFLVELRSQGLVVRHDERRTVHARDALRHGEGLAGAGDPEQHLRAIAAVQPVDQLVDRMGLVAEQREIGDEVKAVVFRGHRSDDGTTRSEGRGPRAEGRCPRAEGGRRAPEGYWPRL